MPLSTIFQIYRGGQFYWWRKSKYPVKTTVSVHLAKQFQKRRFLEINQPETRIAYGSHVC
jgi:hypothetical protein